VRSTVNAEDPDGDDLTYAWNLDGRDLSCTAAICIHTFGDDGTYPLRITVSDGKDTASRTIDVSVLNADPEIRSLVVDGGSADLALPLVHPIRFYGSFTDPGWQDVHAATWDFGDGESETGAITGTTSDRIAGGDVVEEHVYAAPGDYTIQLRVEDDDGGLALSTVRVHIATPSEALRDLSAYIQGIDADSFSGKADQRKDALANKFSALEQMIANGDGNGGINSLKNDIRAKADGQIDGKTENDWILGYDNQNEICSLIDDLVRYLAMLR
jgi:PKD domain.